MILGSISQELSVFNKLTSIALASENEVLHPDPEILSLAGNKIGTFITQIQLLLKFFCDEFTLGNQKEKVLELNNHINDLFTQSGDVISYLDMFDLFSIMDVVALTAEPFDGERSSLSQM